MALEAEPMAGRGKAKLLQVPDHRSTPSGQVVEQSWKELVEDLRPPGEQHVGVPTLGDTPPILGVARERVAVHHRDPLVGVGQHPGGEEPGQACPEDDRVVSDPPHLAPPVSCQVLRR